MSRYDYEISKQPELLDVSFDSLIMAAMRRADQDNAFALRMAFPNLWDELWERYHAPGGILEGESSK